MAHRKTYRIRTHVGAWIYPVESNRPTKRARVKLPFEVDAVKHIDEVTEYAIYEFTWKDAEWTIDSIDATVLPKSLWERLQDVLADLRDWWGI